MNRVIDMKSFLQGMCYLIVFHFFFFFFNQGKLQSLLSDGSNLGCP